MVEKGRAGDAAVIRLDSANLGVHIDQNFRKGEYQMALKKVKIDGVEYEAEADVIKALTTSQNRVDELSKENEQLKKDALKLEGERDQFEDECVQLKKDKKDKGKDENFDKLVDEAVKKRMVIFDAAKRAGVEIKEDSTDLDVKKEIIAKLFPSSKEKIDKAEESYIDARFDVALEYLDDAEDKEDVDDVNDDLSRDSLGKEDKSKKHNSDAAYANMVKRITSGWDREDVSEEVN